MGKNKNKNTPCVSGVCDNKKKTKCRKGGIGKLITKGPIPTGCKPKYSNKFGPLVDTSCGPKILLAEADMGHTFDPNSPVANFDLGKNYRNQNIYIKGTATVTGLADPLKFKIKKPVKTNKDGQFSFPLPANTTAFSICATINLGGGECTASPKCCVKVGSQQFSQYTNDLYWMAWDGSANNLSNPTWGMIGEALLQVTPVSYEDGVSTLAVRGPLNPNPRVISNAVHKQTSNIPNALGLTDLVWMWGQFVDHEITLVEGGTEPANFMSLSVVDDPNEDFPNRTINFTRNQFIEDSNPRQHPNHISAYIDATNVYGYSTQRGYALRNLDGTGTLKTSAGNLLPLNVDGIRNENGPAGVPEEMFLAGDIRANEVVPLTSMHTLLMREHNRVVTQVIPGRYPQFVGVEEMLYQQGRRYVNGVMQSITYNQFLPALLGQPLPPYTGYDDTVNAQMRKEFSTVAYRLGHTMLSEVLKIGSGSDTLPLMDSFFNPDYIKTNGIDDVILGGGLQVMQEIDGKIVDAVRNNLFEIPSATNLLDLAAINIQRGRDQGIGSFNDIREAYGLPKVTTVAQITSDAGEQAALISLYGADAHEHIDPWTGVIIEDHAPGSAVGPTLRAVLIEQFTRLRAGDRYFYLNDPGLSDLEKNEITNTNFVDVIVRNTNNTLADFGNRTDVFRL